MRKSTLLYILLFISISTLLAQPAEFDYTPNNISGGVIATVQVNGIPASGLDYIAAFDEDNNCAGAVQLVEYYGQAFCNLQVYGDDTTTLDADEGMNAGETFTFKLWVSATDEILEDPVDIDPVTGWDAGLNGVPVPGYDFPDGVVLNFLPNVDEDMDGLFSTDDPDDTDPCNPNNTVAACDTDGDGIPNGLDPPDEFDFTPNNISGGAIGTVQVNGIPASGSDYIAAFDEDNNCAGAVQLIEYYSQAFFNLQVYGNDNTTPGIDEGMDAGETFRFRLWVAATDEILEDPVDIVPVVGWDAGLNGQTVPGYDFSDGVVLNFLTNAIDEDMDGFSGTDDPDDTDPCNPDNNVTVCDNDGDGIPNGSDPFPDCDGSPDECGVCNGSGIAAGTCDCAGTLPSVWYADNDGDGLGDPNNSTESCDQPAGFVSNSNDDNDECDGVLDECGVCNGSGIAAGTCDCAGTLPSVWYADNDGDGLGDPNNSTESCDQPAGFVSNSNDNNDECDGVLDECGVCNGSGIAAGTCDCAGTLPSVWYADNDGDGLGDPNNSTESCDQPAGFVSNSNDDNDECDGVLDECGVCNGSGIAAGTCDCAGNLPSVWFADNDGDGLGDPNNSTESCDQPAGFVSNSNDDNDSCDGVLDECGVCNGSGIAAGTCDCAGSLPSVWYADNDGDGLGDPNNSTESCDQPAGFVSNSNDNNDECDGVLDECGVCNGSGIAAGTCDCAGTLPSVWYADNDGDGLGDPNNSTESCDQPAGFVSNSNDNNDECDGVLDECGVCNGSGIAAGTCDCAGTLPSVWYADNDGDGLGDPNNSTESCDQPAGFVSNSNDDNDSCGGVLDECGICNGSGPSVWFADNDGDGLGDPNNSTESCDQPAGFVSNSNDEDDNIFNEPTDIPTLSQWGLIVLSLILFSITTVSVTQNRYSLMYNRGGIGSYSIVPYFDATLFKRMLLKSVPLMILVSVLISLFEGEWLVRNFVGTAFSIGLVVYLLHFIKLSERLEDERKN